MLKSCNFVIPSPVFNLSKGMEILFINVDNFGRFLESLSKEFDCYALTKFSAPKPQEKAYLHAERLTPALIDKVVVNEIRPSEPIKSFLHYSRERLDTIPDKKKVLLGVKACDIKSLVIQDFVFKTTDPEDPFYAQKRESTYIIASDCDLLHESCFCTATGATPYSKGDFDLNLSHGVNGYLVEIGSAKGSELIKKNENLFTEAEKRQIEARDTRREEFTAQLAKQVQDQGVPAFEFLAGKMRNKYASGIWEETSKTCIECGACNLVCPTCHCFAISDQKKDNLTARYRSWDACLYKRFAVVAGGANPRRHLAERLRNRFDKKFDFFPEVLKTYACTGCGRCFEACPGEIDIREILKKLVK